MKVLFVFFLTIVVLGGGHFYLNHKDNPTRIIPYPYLFQEYVPENTEDAQKAQILIVGDKSAKDLKEYLPPAIDEISRNLRNSLPYYNWGNENEGLHRVLAKLQSLDKWPPIVIFALGNSEFYEKKFHMKDYDTINKNFDRYKDGNLLTAIMTYPELSKVIYTPPKYVQLGKEIKKETLEEQRDGVMQMAYFKLSYQIFEHEIEELILLAREKESTLILMTSPINYDEPPKKICANTETDTLAEYQYVLEDQLEAKQYKIAYEKLKKLTEVSLANAKTWYLYGIAAREVGDYEQAKKAMRNAASYDCVAWRSTPVLNSIIKRKAEQLGAIVIDFDSIININYGRDALFLNSYQPQVLYYDRMMIELKNTIKEILKI